MKRFAQVDNGKITGEVTGPGDFDPGTLPPGRVMIDVTDRPDIKTGAVVTGLGKEKIVTDLNGIGFAVSTASVRREIAKVDFLRLLQPSEYLAMVQKAEAGDAMLTYGLAVLAAARFIDPDDAILVMLTAYAVSVNVLTAPRRDAIIAALHAL